MIERILGITGVGDTASHFDRFWAFRICMVLVVAADNANHISDTPTMVHAVIALVCLVFVFRPRWARLAVAVVGVSQLILAIRIFPQVANHLYLGIMVLAVLSLADDKDEREVESSLNVIRWMCVIVFFHAGFQKVWYGLYFDGRFLAYYMSIDSFFRAFLGTIVSSEDLLRLVGYDAWQAGAGPYRVSSIPFIVLSNLVWITEISLAPALCISALRKYAVPVALLFLFGTETVAREVMFGVMFSAMVLLFARREWNRRLLPVYAGLLLYVILARHGWMPDFDFG